MYDVILIDPPWEFTVWDKDTGGDRSASNHYEVMNLERLKKLPILSLCNNNCAVFLWATWPNIEQAFEVVRSWSADEPRKSYQLRYRTLAWEWIKLSRRWSSRLTKPFVDQLSNGDTNIFTKLTHMGLGYYTRCLTGNTSVYVQTPSDVREITLQELYQSDWLGWKIWSHTGWRDIQNVIKSYPKQGVRIKTVLGEITCSHDHRLACKHLVQRRVTGDRSKRIRDHVVEYLDASRIRELRHGSVAQGNASVNLVASTLPIDPENPTASICEITLSEDLGWLVGLFVAEGNYKARRNGIQLSLHSKEKDIIERIEQIVYDLNIMQDRYIYTPVRARLFIKDNRCSVQASSKKIVGFIGSFVLGRGACSKRLNRGLLLNTSAAFRKGVLDGILDGDGSSPSHWSGSYRGYSSITLCNAGLISDIVWLATSLGIMAKEIAPGIRKANHKGGGRPYYTATFLSPRNKDLVLAGARVVPVRIDEFEDCETVAMYDLTVEGGAFVLSNGIISHNSNPEPCLLLVRGSMPVSTRSERNLLFAPVGRHSQKPDEQYEKIDRLYPGTSRLEIFARQRYPGWYAIGGDVDGDDIFRSIDLLNMLVRENREKDEREQSAERL